jgi:hypothetical protein
MPLERSLPKPLSSLSCSDHPEGRIHWEPIPGSLPNGLQIIVERPFCTAGEQPHGFKIPWLRSLENAIGDLVLPTDLQLELRRHVDIESKQLPTGVYEFESQSSRKLYLPTATTEAIARMRRRIKYAPRAYNKYRLSSITDLRLNAIFFGPPGTGKSSAFLDVTEGLVERRLYVSLRGLVGGHLGDTERNLMELTNFVSQYSNKPGRLALLLDDADDFCSARGDDSSAAGQTLNALKVGMLHLMDMAQGVPIILTTNRLASLDSAIHRRIVEHIEFALPDEAARALIISGFLDAIELEGGSLSAEELASLVSVSESFSPAELALAVVDGVCEIEAGSGITLFEAIEGSIKSRRDMRSLATISQSSRFQCPST